MPRRQRRSVLFGEGRALARATASSFDELLNRGSEAYRRISHLPRVLPVGPDELADVTIEGRRRILARLARALRAERHRGRSGHWSYDLNRHIALVQAYTAEQRLLEENPPPKSS